MMAFLMRSTLFLMKITVFLLFCTTLALSFEDDLTEEEIRDLRSEQSSRMTPSSPRTAVGILSSISNRRQDSSSGNIPVIVSSSASDQKPSRASLFFNGNNGGGLFGSGGILGGQSARTILVTPAVPASGALTASCCPCAAGSVINAASGALISPGGGWFPAGFAAPAGFTPAVSGQLIATPLYLSGNAGNQRQGQDISTTIGQLKLVPSNQNAALLRHSSYVESTRSSAEALEGKKKTRRLRNNNNNNNPTQGYNQQIG